MKKITHTITCILLVLFAGRMNAQLSGVVTVPGTYASIAAAINDLNTLGVSGAVTVNIAAGYTETAPVGGYTLNAITGASSTNQVTFQKSGTGANPLISAYAGGTATPTSAIQDVVWRFNGTDYVTINGIDITDPNAANPATMEYGYGFFKASAADGCQNNTIKNCVVTLNRINNAAGSGASLEGSKCIGLVNATGAANTTALTITSAAGSNSNNKFYSNTLQNCNVGITVTGFADVTPFAFADSGNDIGGSSSATGNSIINFGGGGTTQTEAVSGLNQYNFNVSYNVINNNNGSGVSSLGILRGIYNGVAVSANTTINSNTITLIMGNVNATFRAIDNLAGSTPANNALNINNNLLVNCVFGTTSAGAFDALFNVATTSSISISSNTLSNMTINGTSASGGFIHNDGAAFVLNFNNNLVDGYRYTAATSGAFNFVYSNGADPTATLSISNNTARNMTSTVTVSSSYGFLLNNKPTRVMNFNNNTFDNLSLNTTGGVTFLDHGVTYAAGAVQNVIGNNILGSFTKTGAGGTVTFYTNTNTGTAGAVITHSNNNFSNINLIGGTTIAGWVVSGTGGATKLITNNTFTNIVGGTNGITLLSFNGNGNNSSVSNNLITNVTGGGAITGITMGTTGTSTLSTVANNTVSVLTSTGGAITGFSIGGGTSTLNINNNMAYTYSTTAGSLATGMIVNVSGTTNVFKNKIYDISANNAGGTVNGLTASNGSQCNIFNNIIGDLKAPASLAANAINGLNISGGTNMNAYFNSVYLNASSSATAFGSSAVNVNTSPTSVVFRNNIFVNLSTPSGTALTVASRRSSTLATNYSSASNNNLFYAGTPGANNLIFTDGTNVPQTLAAYKTLMATRDAQSVTENPTFLSTTSSNAGYLSVSTSVATQIESGATPVTGVTDDYAGTLRNTGTPDIGAWEGNYVISDGIAPNIISAGFTSLPCSLTGRTFTLALSDGSGVGSGANSPRVYFKLNSGAYTSVAGTLTSGTALSGVWTFNLAYSGSFLDVVSYYVVAQDVAGTPNLVASPSTGFAGTDVNTVTTPPTTPPTYVLAALNGVYTVGAAGTFTSLTAAANIYNVACLTGPVTFSLTDALYSTNEVFPIVFGNNTTASSTNSLLVRPATGLAVAITPTSTSMTAAIKFLNAKFITIDGLNASGSSLIINNSNTSSAANVWLASSGVGCNNIGIKNTTINGGSSSSSYGIIAGVDGSSPSTSSAADNDFVTISNNTILNVNYGIYAAGTSSATAGGLDNWSIANNQIGPVASGTNNLGNAGIIFSNGLLLSVNNNTIGNIISGAGSYLYGISLGSSVNTSTISSNTIRSIKYTGTGGYGGIGIDLNTGLSLSNITIQNNMIADVGGDSWTTFTSGGFAGIRVGSGSTTGGLNIYNNTVSMNQGNSNAGNSQTNISAAIYFASGVTGIDLRNNILYSNIQYTVSGSRTYAIYSDAPIAAFTNINYNNYSVGGTQGILGYIGSTRVALTDIQTGFGSNLNSTNVIPAFTSTIDLHLLTSVNVALDNTGTPLSSVTVDIDNQSRNATTPDMGADEFTSAFCTSANGGTAVTSAAALCSGGAFTLNVSGVSTGSTLTQQWKVAPTSGGTYTNVTGATGLSYATNSLTAGTYYFILASNCANNSTSGVSNEVTVTINPTPTATLTINSNTASACAGTPLNLSAGTNVGTTFAWSGPNGFTSTSQNVSVSASASASNSGVYTLTVSTASCTAAITSSNISVNNFPAAVSSINNSASSPVCAGASQTLSALPSAGTLTAVFGTQAVTTLGASTAAGAYPAPYNSYYGGQRMQTLITAAELNAAGLGAGEITGVQFPVVSAGTYFPGNGDASFKIKMAATTLTALTSFVAGLPTVAPAITFTPAAGYNNTHTFTPGAFIWDGVSNVIMETTFSNNLSGGTAHAVTQYASPTSYASTIVYRADSQTPAAIEAGTSVTFGYNSRADMKLFGSKYISYIWSPSTALSSTVSASVVANPTITTTYSVLPSIGGCITGPAALITVSVNALPTLTVSGNTALCSGRSATLVASGNGTGYTWSDGSTNANLVVTPSVTTNYTVTAANALCTNSTAINIPVSASPTVAIAASPATLCAGTTVTLTASGATSYTWGLGTVSASIVRTPSATAIYTVSGTTGSCTTVFTKTLNVTPLPVLSVSSQTICPNGTASIPASGASTYLWDNGTTSPTLVVTPTVNTTYSVTGSALGCASTATASVFISSYLSINVAATNTSICSGGSTTLTASGVSSYSWNTGATTSSIVVNPSSTTGYSLTGSNGVCPGTGFYTVGIISPPAITITSVPGNTVCSGQSLTLAANGSYASYSWLTTGLTGTAITVNPASSTIYSVTGTTSTGDGCVTTQTVGITTNTLPAITIVASSPTVCLTSPVTYTASGAVTYSWTTGSNTNTTSAVPTASATTYTVNGINAAGCSSSQTVAVTTVSLPVVTIAPGSTIVCSGSPATFTASGAVSYTWAGGPSTAGFTVNPTANTTYTVRGSNAQGCISSKTVAIATNSLPVVSISPASPTICSTSTVNLTASGANTYVWTGGPSTSTYVVNPAVTTTYSVAGTSTTTGCVGTKTVSVFTNTLPALSVSPVTTTICAQSLASFTASGATSYLWSNGATQNSVLLFTAGNTTYSVTGTNPQGCTITATVAAITLSLPAIALSPASSTACPFVPTTYTASGADSYTWTNSASTGSTAVFTSSAISSYTVAGTAANGCTANISNVVFVYSLPTIAVAASSQTVCSLSPVNFTATGATTYTWSNGHVGDAVTVNPLNSSVVYTVTGTDVNSCVNTQTASVATNPLPVLVITPASTAVCAHTPVTLAASGANSYVWSTNSINQSIVVTPTANASYTVSGTDALGCVGTQTTTITVNQLPVIIVSPASATVCISQDGSSASFTATGANSYAWAPGNSTSGTFIAAPSVATVYTVTGTDNNNCVGKTLVNVEVSLCDGIKTTSFSGNVVSVYPNPSNGAFTAKFEFEGTKTVMITNSVGQVITQTTTTNTSESFNLSDTAKGVYFVKISTKEASGNYKIIIE